MQKCGTWHPGKDLRDWSRQCVNAKCVAYPFLRVPLIYALVPRISGSSLPISIEKRRLLVFRQTNVTNELNTFGFDDVVDFVLREVLR